MKIAAIILNYFGFNDTCACIKSVREHLDAQLFLVDNSDDIEERKRLQNEYRNDPDVELLFPPENIGFAAGVNLGLRKAVTDRYQYFLLLNNDAVLLPGSGNGFMQALRNNPGSLISPTVIWDEKINKGSYYNKYFGIISDTPYLGGFGSLYYFTGCALAFDKKFIDMVGFLDEDFFFYGEDVEYSHRATKNKASFILIPERLVRHEGNKSAKKASLFYEYHVLRAHWLLIFKINDTPGAKLLAIMGKSCVLATRSLWRCLRFITLAPMAAYIMAPLDLQIKPEKNL